MTESVTQVESDFPIVRLEGIEKVYRGFPDVRALSPVDLDIHGGDFLSIVGPSGSGKSTLLNVLGLLDRPTAGKYLLSGREVAGLSETERAAARGHQIGFVFQSFQLMEKRTAIENVLLATAYQGMTYAQSLERATNALDAVGMTKRANVAASRLSGGERQRVAIARALAGNPTLLLCDEPTGNLDSANSDGILRVLLDLNTRGATIVLITHNEDIAARASRRAVIRDGVFSLASAS